MRADVTVRRIRADDWPLSRQLRLEALADTPVAFMETLAAARLHGDDVWQARAARGAEGGDSFQVLAVAGDRAVASCLSFVDDGRCWLGGVYVTPAHRGAGLLAQLVAACADWARRRGATELLLEVHETNARARAAYARLGFVETGATRAYPLEPGGRELEMALRLS